jgi:hypothetical protein
MVKKGSTLILKGTVIALGLLVLALCIFALPSIWKGGSSEFPYASTSLLLIIIGMYVTTIPFYIALWQTLKLLNYIDKNTAFSDLSIKALKIIKRCAIIISAVYMGFVPFLFPIADADDAPGLILMGFAAACIPLVIAVFAAVLARLLQNAIDMKSENDLTV